MCNLFICYPSVFFKNMVVFLTNSQITLNGTSPKNKYEAMVNFWSFYAQT